MTVTEINNNLSKLIKLRKERNILINDYIRLEKRKNDIYREDNSEKDKEQLEIEFEFKIVVSKLNKIETMIIYEEIEMLSSRFGEIQNDAD